MIILEIFEKIIDRIKSVRWANPLIWAGAFGAVLLISVIFIGARSARFTDRVFFYPDHLTSVLHGEKRPVRTKYDQRKSVKIYLEELSLGPIDKLKNNFLTAEARIKSVFIKKSDVLIDFSGDFALFEADSSYKLADISKYLLKNLQFNFPWVKSVQIYIDGELAGSDFHTDFLYFDEKKP